MEADIQVTLESRNQAYKKVLDRMEGKMKEQELRLKRILALHQQTETARQAGADEDVEQATCDAVFQFVVGLAGGGHRESPSRGL